MKKLLLILALLSVSLAPAFALFEDSSIDKSHKVQQKISEIAFKLLNGSRVDKIIPVHYHPDKKNINAYAWKYGTTFVIIPKGIVRFFESDDEMAAIIAHELSHGITISEGFSKRFAMNLNPKKYEYQADKMGIDLMVNAGYNPVAMIVAFTKFAPQEFYDIFSTHPKTSKRLATMYAYIYTKYPQYLANNAYKDNVYYQNFLLTSKENRKNFEQKAEYSKGGTVNVRFK